MKNGELKNTITYLPQKEIDKSKWDECISNAGNGLIYARSFFLDGMSKHWDALVMNDYDAVMPLIWNKKYGLHYLYQPAFTRFTGIFGNTINTDLVNYFLSFVPKHFKYWDIDFVENLIDPQKINIENVVLKKRNNFLLALDKSYAEINKCYKRLAHRMIKKALENNIEIIRDEDPKTVISFYKNNYKDKQQISLRDYETITATTSEAFKKGMASTYIAKQKGKIVAAYLILNDKKFIYSLIGGSNDDGKKTGAFYLLTDAAIKDNSESQLIFRFEGSDKKGIELFNSQFGPRPVEYYNIRSNKLPWPIKFLK